MVGPRAKSELRGIVIPPVWRIVPADRLANAQGAAEEREICIGLEPGPGFGTGEHETTQLCLQAIHAFRPRTERWRLLDFGSGSGVLSIAAARLGAEVDAVEIDERAIEHARANARSNGVSEQIRFAKRLDEIRGGFEIVVANILLSVLVEAAAELVARLAPRGVLILSGLVATDVPAAIARYSPELGGRRPEVYARGEWRALSFVRG